MIWERQPEDKERECSLRRCERDGLRWRRTEETVSDARSESTAEADGAPRTAATTPVPQLGRSVTREHHFHDRPFGHARDERRPQVVEGGT